MGMARNRWRTATAALLCCGVAGCGIGGSRSAARSTPGSAPIWQGAPLTGEVSPQALRAAEAAGLSEAVTLLDLLPTYPGAQVLSAGQYVRVATTAAGGATTADAEGLARAMGAPASPYLIDIYREWSVREGEARVTTWLKAEAAARGLIQSGGVVPVGSGDEIAAIGFSRSRGVEVPSLDVDMRAPDPGETLVRYDAIVIWHPPRPAGEFLGAGPQAVTVDALTGTGFGPEPRHVVASKVVDSAKEVATLVSLVNDLPRDTRGPHGCPALTGTRSIKMIFHYRGGSAVTVTEGVCDGVLFGAQGANPVLADPTLQLWTLTAYLVGESAWVMGGTAAPPSVAPA